MGTRIVLVGEHERLKGWLARILRDGGFQVDCYAPGAVRGDLRNVSGPDTVLILGIDVAENLPEDSILNTTAQGFLVFDPRCAGRNGEPSYLLHTEMSPEEIIATINDLVFQRCATRNAERIRFNTFVEYRYDEKEHSSMLYDISETGLFISTLAPPPVGSHITVRFSLRDEHQIVAQGRVIFQITYDLDRKIIAHPSATDRKIAALPGMGIMFETIADTDRQTIREFISQRR